MKGSYLLVYRLEEDEEIEVGSLGVIRFKKGVYVYSGSAFGPGGFKRVSRHRRLCNEGKGKKHWHIDYISDNSSSKLLGAFLIPEEDFECSLAQKLDGEPVEGFGCSDCNCPSHLLGYGSSEIAVDDIRKNLDLMNLEYHFKNFNMPDNE